MGEGNLNSRLLVGEELDFAHFGLDSVVQLAVFPVKDCHLDFFPHEDVFIGGGVLETLQGFVVAEKLVGGHVVQGAAVFRLETSKTTFLPSPCTLIKFITMA